MTTTRTPLTTLALGVMLGLALLASTLTGSTASSHREAPLITEDPVADNTDVYAFTDSNAPGTVNLIANWIPLQEPASGPNFHKFGDDVLYTINVDNDHDAIPDVVYEFRFRTPTRQDNTFLYNTGPINNIDDDTWNRPQFYSVTKVVDGQRTELTPADGELMTPPVNIGPRSTPDYQALADQATFTLDDGSKVFAGQRDEVFPVDLGAVFDLAGLRPLNGAHLLPLDAEPGLDTTSGYNVHTIALQVPTSELVVPASEDIVAVWSETYRRKARVFLGNDGARPQHQGPWVQVSRLGMPLVNEVVIPLRDKDRFNASSPSGDAQFLDYVRFPEIDDRVLALYPPFQAEDACFPDDAVGGWHTEADAPRDDLVGIFLTGLDAFGNKPSDGTPYEAIRLNVTSGQSQFPNGRHPQDDVVDAALIAVAGGLPGQACAGVSPNADLTDGVAVQQGEAPIMGSFPYLPLPHQGYDHQHDHGQAGS